MLKEYSQVATSKSQQKELGILVQSLMISFSKKNICETKCSHEKSIWVTCKDSRNSTASYLFCLYVRIQIQIYFFLTNSAWCSLLKLSPPFIPVTTGGHICSDAEWVLLSLPVKVDGLGLQNLYEVANIELLNSKEITRELYDKHLTQNKDFQKRKPSKMNWKQEKFQIITSN